MEDKKKMAELAEKELKEEKKKKQFAVIKEAIKRTLEKLEEKKKQRKELDEEIKILKQDIDNIREGRLDLIEERQKKDEKARETSTIIIEREKIVEKPYPYPVEPYPYPIKPWHEPWYQPYRIWWTTATDSTSGSYEIINCSMAKDASPGTYELADGTVKSFI